MALHGETTSMDDDDRQRLLQADRQRRLHYADADKEFALVVAGLLEAGHSHAEIARFLALGEDRLKEILG